MNAPNWFIGWPFEAEVSVEGPPARVRVFGPGDRHVTLAFLGACRPASARDAWQAALELDLEPISVDLAEVQMLGHPERPSAITALLGAGRAEVGAAIERHRARLLAAAGARPESRPAKAHVTLARVQRRASPIQYDHAVAWAAQLAPEAQARLGRLALYTWAEDRAQALFRIVESRDL